MMIRHDDPAGLFATIQVRSNVSCAMLVVTSPPKVEEPASMDENPVIQCLPLT
jgi:hypothetical protein